MAYSVTIVLLQIQTKQIFNRDQSTLKGRLRQNQFRNKQMCPINRSTQQFQQHQHKLLQTKATSALNSTLSGHFYNVLASNVISVMSAINVCIKTYIKITAMYKQSISLLFVQTIGYIQQLI